MQEETYYRYPANELNKPIYWYDAYTACCVHQRTFPNWDEIHTLGQYPADRNDERNASLQRDAWWMITVRFTVIALSRAKQVNVGNAKRRIVINECELDEAPDVGDCIRPVRQRPAAALQCAIGLPAHTKMQAHARVYEVINMVQTRTRTRMHTYTSMNEYLHVHARVCMNAREPGRDLSSIDLLVHLPGGRPRRRQRLRRRRQLRMNARVGRR